MQSRLTAAFIKRFRKLPDSIRLETRKAYGLWLIDPSSARLKFKQISKNYPLWSARVFNTGYRAAGFYYKDRDTIEWEFVGNHSDYEAFYKQWQ